MEVGALLTFGSWIKSIVFFFSCHSEQYQLVNLTTTRIRGIDVCRAACLNVSMALMKLHSDHDRKAIVDHPDYNSKKLVTTDAIEVLDKSKNSMFFSSPGGKKVNFISPAGYVGKRDLDTPGNYSIVIYYEGYYSRDSVVDTTDQCACNLGESRLYSRHADFDAERLLRQCKAVLLAVANTHLEFFYDFF